MPGLISVSERKTCLLTARCTCLVCVCARVFAFFVHNENDAKMKLRMNERCTTNGIWRTHSHMSNIYFSNKCVITIIVFFSSLLRVCFYFYSVSARLSLHELRANKNDSRSSSSFKRSWFCHRMLWAGCTRIIDYTCRAKSTQIIVVEMICLFSHPPSIGPLETNFLCWFFILGYDRMLANFHRICIFFNCSVSSSHSVCVRNIMSHCHFNDFSQFSFLWLNKDFCAFGTHSLTS